MCVHVAKFAKQSLDTWLPLTLASSMDESYTTAQGQAQGTSKTDKHWQPMIVQQGIHSQNRQLHRRDCLFKICNNFCKFLCSLLFFSLRQLTVVGIAQKEIWSVELPNLTPSPLPSPQNEWLGIQAPNLFFVLFIPFGWRHSTLYWKAVKYTFCDKVCCDNSVTHSTQDSQALVIILKWKRLFGLRSRGCLHLCTHQFLGHRPITFPAAAKNDVKTVVHSHMPLRNRLRKLQAGNLCSSFTAKLQTACCGRQNQCPKGECPLWFCSELPRNSSFSLSKFLKSVALI